MHIHKKIKFNTEEEFLHKINDGRHRMRGSTSKDVSRY